jgi:2-keto-4-pentenoate hydratase/2-oxohepta-3-ene-1,7-dioic acid hydratase in catechol pathway
MKIARYLGIDGDRRWAVLDDEDWVLHPLLAPFAEWAPIAASATSLDELPVGESVRAGDVALLAPLRPGARIFGTGINYGSHLLDAKRPDAAHPPTPPGYIKLDSTIVDPFGELRYPSTTTRLDYEVELVAVVARPIADDEDPTAALLGYTVGNDVCHRDEPSTAGQPATELFSRKSLDATAPVGPWVTTLAEIGVGQPDLRISQTINGDPRQDDRTKNMHVTIPEILDWFDSRARLQPGDLLFTGTVGGVGLLTNQFLAPGDRLDASIEKIGTLIAWVGEPSWPR